MSDFELRPVAWVESGLRELGRAPMQGDEGAPDAWLVFEPDALDALHGLEVGQRVILLTWLDRADRSVLRTHPRDDLTQPEQGVFNTRSPDRPNPIGLHEVEILAVEGARLHVTPLEAIDGTPVVDVKPLLGPR